MLTSIRRRFAPGGLVVSVREIARAACGALLGILATGLVARAALGSNAGLPVLIAPMGASAVLLFAVPSSPLARPWSILGGNTLAALVGASAAATIADPVIAAALALALAIALMSLLNCLHPPSGAVALTAVLGGPTIRDLGLAFALWPTGVNSVLLLGCALAFNALTRRPRPPAAAGPADADLDAALAGVDEVLDIRRDDLRAILRRAQAHALARGSRQTTCAHLLSRRVHAVAPGAMLGEALDLLRSHDITMVPVTDDRARVLGVVTQNALIDKTFSDGRGLRLGLAHRMRLRLRHGRAPHGAVADVMTTAFGDLRPETKAPDAALMMSEIGLHHAPVLETDGRLAGIVAQADLVAAMIGDLASRPEMRAEMREEMRAEAGVLP